MIGTGVIDAALPPAGFDFGGVDRWHLLVLHEGAPAARVDLPDPGPVRGTALIEAALWRRGDAERARQALLADLRRRLGARDEDEPPLEVSVVVCTRRRPRMLADLLAGLADLDPAPLEVIVVDNDPGEEDCRDVVAAAGFRYVREDRRGLDNARNAGLRAAGGEVVAFVDDDCVVPPGWLRPLRHDFARHSVAAVTGPAFPYLLDTPARERMEAQASLARGLRRERFDWQTISPLHAAATGIGANMAIRRDRLARLRGPFPPELDAGTETESGGDTYVLGMLLAGGERVIYEPRSFVFHQHRDDGPALRKAVLGYGIGLSAALTKLVLEERELSAPRAWAWLPRQYLRTQRRRAVGRADSYSTRLSWHYLRGGFLGTGAWRRALRGQAPAAPASDLAAPISSPPALAEAPAGRLEVSVVIPTYRREEALARCLEALRAQDVPATSFEVIVVDDDPDSERLGEPAQPFAARRVANPGEGAAAARNHGAALARAELVLFLDDDVVPEPWLLRRHLERRRAGTTGVLVGAYWPRPASTGLAAEVARLWWFDFFDLLAEAPSPTFVAALTANMSVPRALFAEVGGFSEELSRQRREDWEWGLRIRRAGVPIEFDPLAAAHHDFSLGTEQRLRDAMREGFGDALIARRFPEAIASLPLVETRPWHSPLRRLAFALWGFEPCRRAYVACLDALEWARMRQLWSRGVRHGQGVAYARGAHAGGWMLGASAEPPPYRLELLDPEPIEPPSVAAPRVAVTLEGEEVASVRPSEGVWSGALAERIVDELEPEIVLRAAARSGWLRPAEAATALERVEILLGPGTVADEEALAERGAAVRRVDAGDWWPGTLEAARAGERPLVAIPLPGTEPGPDWLEDALAAFDSERVGLCFGGGLPAGDPPDALYLHDERDADGEIVLGDRTPDYVVLRRELLASLPADGDPADGVLAALPTALDGGWQVGHRDARGLGSAAIPRRAWARALGRREAALLRSLPPRRRARRAGARTVHGVLILGWAAFKGRGRLTAPQRAAAAGVIEGVLCPSRGRSTSDAGPA